jgi:uncharacterized tellurite resistance protein B-like protein
MSILEILGLKRPDHPSSSDGDTETVRRIVRELQSLDPGRARYIAAFAYVLGRVAYADREISDGETATMELLVEDIGGLEKAQAVLVVAIAKEQARLFAGTENYLVTREFRGVSTREQREQLLHCLFAVAAADDTISVSEEAQVRQIASELGCSDEEFIAIRAAYNDKREVVKLSRSQGAAKNRPQG